MDLTRPYTAVVPSLDGDVLVTLALATGGLTGRQIARLVPDASPRGAQLVLDRLVGQGLVLREQAGRAYLYELNAEHVAAEAVLSLATLRGKLLSRLREAIGQWDQAPVHASLYGSAARGTGGVSSDLDIFLVRSDAVDPDDPRWESQVDALRAAAQRWSGNEVQVLEISESEAHELVAQDHEVVRAVRDEGVDLAGVPARRFLRSRERR